MCEACYAECETIGEILPGLALVQAKKSFRHIEEGMYGLVRLNSPDLVWAARPMPDPFFGMTDDEIDAAPQPLLSDFLVFDLLVTLFSKACEAQLSLTTAYDIGCLCQAAGYNRKEDGLMEHWLFHRMGALLKSQEV